MSFRREVEEVITKGAPNIVEDGETPCGGCLDVSIDIFSNFVSGLSLVCFLSPLELKEVGKQDLFCFLFLFDGRGSSFHERELLWSSNYEMLCWGAEDVVAKRMDFCLVEFVFPLSSLFLVLIRIPIEVGFLTRPLWQRKDGPCPYSTSQFPLEVEVHFEVKTYFPLTTSFLLPVEVEAPSKAKAQPIEVAWC